MDYKIKLLYITFVDIEKPAKSASALRPQRMLKAFKELGCEIHLVSGISNDKKKRMKATQQANAWLDTNTPDICYIEPPTGPFFFSCDLKLLKRIHSLGIPTGLFYRDAYWKFPEFEIKKKESFKRKLKNIVIKNMQLRDYKIFKQCCTILYFPSQTMANYFDFSNKKPLPPGCFIPDDAQTKTTNNTICTGIYVGGATQRYGLNLLLDSYIKINEEGNKLNLKIVCQKEAWQQFLNDFPMYKNNYTWLEIHHINSGEKLQELYRGSDFSIIPRDRTVYHDFAMPVKLFEYTSNLLPIISTNCIETEKFILENDIGITTEDNVEAFSKGLLQMSNDKEKFEKFKENCLVARQKNDWASRAKTLIVDLSKTIKEV